MPQEIRYVQLDTQSFIDICNENKALKNEIILLEKHIEELQHSAHQTAGQLRKLKSRANTVECMREWRFRHNLKKLDKDITSFDEILKENIALKKENAELKEKLSD